MFYLCDTSGKIIADLRSLVAPHNENPSMPELTIDQALQKGIEAHEAGQVQEANRLYTAILKAQPKHPDANHNMGILACSIGNFKQAENLIMTAISVNSNIANFWLSLINVYVKSNNHLALIHTIPFLIESGQKNADGDQLYEVVMSLISEIPEINPNNLPKSTEPSQSQIIELINLLKSATYEKAKISIEQLLMTFPISYNLHYLHGIALNSSGLYVEAILAYSKSLAFRKTPDTYYNKGNTEKRLGKIEQAIVSYKEALRLDPKHYDSLLNLANCRLIKGEADKAIASLLIAIDLFPNREDAYLNLAGMYTKLLMVPEAVTTLKKILYLNPENETAKHRLSSINGDHLETASKDYVEKHFDQFAEDFENKLVNKLSYSTPKKTLAVLQKTIPNFTNLEILDLGCGTGLMGSVLHPHACTIDGVDLSSKMLEKAFEKGIYKNLYNSDIINFIKDNALNYDLITIIDVLVYMGDLTKLFKAIRKKCQNNLYLALTTENLNEGDYKLMPSGRFCHSHNYISKLVIQNQFSIIHKECSVIRTEGKKDVEGNIYILRS